MAKAMLQEEVELLLDKPRDGGPAGKGWVTSQVSPVAPISRVDSVTGGTVYSLKVRPPIFSPILWRKKSRLREVREHPKDTQHTCGRSSVAPIHLSAWITPLPQPFLCLRRRRRGQHRARSPVTTEPLCCKGTPSPLAFLPATGEKGTRGSSKMGPLPGLTCSLHWAGGIAREAAGQPHPPLGPGWRSGDRPRRG